MNIKEKIKVMEHFANGGEVELISRDTNSIEWETAQHPNWHWGSFEYRIKQQKQKVVTIEKWLCQVSNNDYVIVESSAINKHRAYKKVKLIESYEVEI